MVRGQYQALSLVLYGAVAENFTVTTPGASDLVELVSVRGEFEVIEVNEDSYEPVHPPCSAPKKVRKRAF